jgi:hypothetical protein
MLLSLFSISDNLIASSQFIIAAPRMQFGADCL